MHAAPNLLSFLLILLLHSGWTNGLCKLENSTVATCYDLKDIKYIDTRDLEFLIAPLEEDVLRSSYLDNLDSLKHLDLSGGDLKKLEPGCFRSLSNLRSLNLGDNHIEYLGLSSLDGLTYLRSLNLRKNAIRQLPPALARLKNLRHLDIHGNPLDCNCATLKVRDLITQRGVTMPKKVVCVSPSNMKGMSLMKPSAAIICSLEQQDREMQNDQAEGSGTELESGDLLDNFTNEEEEESPYVEVHDNSEKTKEVETPFPAVDTTTGSSVIETTSSKESTSTEIISTTTKSLQATEEEEIFFDSEEKKEQTFTTEMSRKENFTDALFYPISGSGDGDDTDEGSGTDDDEKDEKYVTKEENSPSFIDLLFGNLWGTTNNKSKSDLEEEQFINVSSTEEMIASSKSHTVEIGKVTTEAPARLTTSASITNGVEVIKSAGVGSKSGNVKAEVNSELAEVSTAKQSKKGMGSYVVLAALLAVLAALIGFAAYKGNFCRKKRKQNDAENGTELKDMQKSLLPDGANATQPKIASNGNAENMPLVEGPPDGEDTKIDKICNDNYQTQEAAPRSLNGTVDHPDPVKPPRKLIGPQDEPKMEERPRVDVNSLKENFFADRPSPVQPSMSSIATNNGPMTDTSETNGPPLSPGAQRVKIVLQENPDSVPKTPILITRTVAGENLVKTP